MCFEGRSAHNSGNTAHTGTPLDVVYAPSTANDVTGLSNDYRGQAFQRPNVTGSATSQNTPQMLNTYCAGYTFSIPPASAPFGNLGRNSFRAPGLEQWDLGVNKNFRIREIAKSSIPVGIFQCSKPHQFRNSGFEDHRRCVRNYSFDLSAAPDPVRAEAAFLRNVRRFPSLALATPLPKRSAAGP